MFAYLLYQTISVEKRVTPTGLTGPGADKHQQALHQEKEQAGLQRSRREGRKVTHVGPWNQEGGHSW